MPDDRFLHRACGHSRKVNALTSDEFRVWVQYELSADDFGVMLFSSRPLRADNDYLDTKSSKLVQRWLERVRDLGLIQTFEHQDQLYCFQHDWQDYQKVEYPRTTILPPPTADALEVCTPLTRHLFRFYPGGVRIPGGKREQLGSVPGIFPESSPNIPTPRARARPVPANGERLTANGSGGAGGATVIDLQPSDASEDQRARAARFCERYAELYAQHRKGARYHNKPTLDFVEALGIVATWDDARLDQLVEAFLTTDEPFCRNGAGTIAQFRSRASWCDSKLREAGL